MWFIPTSCRNSNISKVFEGFVDDLFDTTSNWLEAPTRFPADVEDTEKAYVIKAELPGMDKKDINVSVKDEVLTISAERKYDKKKDSYYEMRYSYYERRFGKFERSFRLDTRIDKDNIGAEYKDGVLCVTLNKVVVAQKDAHKIEIK
jgi:HSP20 family protein